MAPTDSSPVHYPILGLGIQETEFLGLEDSRRDTVAYERLEFLRKITSENTRITSHAVACCSKV